MKIGDLKPKGSDKTLKEWFDVCCQTRICSCCEYVDECCDITCGYMDKVADLMKIEVDM